MHNKQVILLEKYLLFSHDTIGVVKYILHFIH